MYKAVFLDMDGTLLRSDHSVSDATKETLRKIIEKGVPVILVSARPVNAMLPTWRSLGLTNFPLVSLNGSYIVENDQPVFQAMIDLPTTAGVSEQVRPFKTTIAYYLQREWYAEVSNEWTAHEQKIMDVQLGVAPLPALIGEWSTRHIGPNKMMIMSDPAAISAAEQHLKSIYNGSLNIYTSKPTYLEVMDPRGSKSNGIKFLIDRMKIGQDEIIAMGDNFNDREMIRFAGMGVAMGNAPEEIKKEADYVTDTNNNDGVRKALEHFFAL
jgi:Cof subfamily protein (haloacid dehalogenase superfamily)